MEIINDDSKKLICIIYREGDWKEGLNFVTPNELFIQVGSWWYNKDKQLFLSLYVDDLKMAGVKANIGPMWKEMQEGEGKLTWRQRAENA